MWALVLGDECGCQRVTTLLEGHVASLNFVVGKSSVATGIEKGLLLKRWSLALHPAGNQSFGPAQNVSRAFGNVGKTYVAQDDTWRLHQNKNEPFVKSQKTAAKRALWCSSRSCTPSTKRMKQRNVYLFSCCSCRTKTILCLTCSAASLEPLIRTIRSLLTPYLRGPQFLVCCTYSDVVSTICE